MDDYFAELVYLDRIPCRQKGCNEMRFVDFDHICEKCICGDHEYNVLEEVRDAEKMENDPGY